MSKIQLKTREYKFRRKFSGLEKVKIPIVEPITDNCFKDTGGVIRKAFENYQDYLFVALVGNNNNVNRVFLSTTKDAVGGSLYDECDVELYHEKPKKWHLVVDDDNVENLKRFFGFHFLKPNKHIVGVCATAFGTYEIGYSSVDEIRIDSLYCFGEKITYEQFFEYGLKHDICRENYLK